MVFRVFFWRDADRWVGGWVGDLFGDSSPRCVATLHLLFCSYEAFVVYCFVTLMLEYAGGDRYALLHGLRHGVLAGHWLLCFVGTVKRPLRPREVSSPRVLVPSFLPSTARVWRRSRFW